MICEICNKSIWRKYKGGYKVHKNCIIPLQVKAELKGENSNISFILRNRNKKINQHPQKPYTGTGWLLDDEIEFKAEYYNEEAWKHEDKQRRGEYFNSVKTIRR